MVCFKSLVLLFFAFAIVACGSKQSSNKNSPVDPPKPLADDIMSLVYDSGGGMFAPGSVALFTRLELERTGGKTVSAHLNTESCEVWGLLSEHDFAEVVSQVSTSPVRVGRGVMMDGGTHTVTLGFRYSAVRAFHLGDDDSSFNDYVLVNGATIQATLKALADSLKGFCPGGNYQSPTYTAI
jgi:hypothetical protein